MEQLPVRARQYIVAVLFLGAATAIVASRTIDLSWNSLILTLALLPLLVAFEVFEIKLPGGMSINLNAVLRLAAIILMGPSYTVVLTVSAIIIASAVLGKNRKAWYKVAFNAAMHGVVSAVAGLTYVALADSDPAVASSINDLIAIAVAGLLYMGLNQVMVSLVVAFAEDLSVDYVWSRNQQTVLPQLLAMLPMGIVFALLWQSPYPWAIALFLMPMGIVHYSFKARVDLESQMEQALIAMADIVDKRDSLTSRHSERVAEYAVRIARQLGVRESQLETITVSAKLHDLGKIGINDSILKKPGALSAEERKDMERHPEIGASILGFFPLFSKGVAFVLHHHERYDGLGYPAGLKREEIPLGARIIQVADAYEAMTARRYYRAPMPIGEAIDRLRAEAGRQFDPMVVGAFLKVMAEEEQQSAETNIRRLEASR
ncbi:MAG: HD-GYP domain-containing protein [Dehalococcoidia bacterium]|nr:HD-GYP domain-containing protein [Dehalococcoidia bacterium]